MTDDELHDAWMEAGATVGSAAYQLAILAHNTAVMVIQPLAWAFHEADARYARRHLDRQLVQAARIAQAARQTAR